MSRRARLSSQANEFLNYCDAVHKSTTVSTYITSLGKLHLFLRNKGKDPENFFEYVARSLLEEWFFEMYEAGLEPASRCLALTNIRCYLKWAHDRGYLKDNPDNLIRRADFPKKPKYVPKPLEPDHDRKLIEYLKTSNELSEMGLLLLRWGGMRVGELRAMPWDCIHQEEDGTHSIYVPPCKMYHDRYVPLTEEGVELVRKIQKYPIKEGFIWKKEYCDRCQTLKNRYQVPFKTPEKLDHLLTRTTGAVISYSGMRSAIARVCKAAGIPHYSIHQLRHTFATSLLNAGVSLPALQKLLGHKKIEMTLRYAEVMQTTVRREYFAAIKKAIEQYDIPAAYETDLPDPMGALADLILLVEKKRQESTDPKSDKKKLLLLQKLRRIQVELAQFI